MVRARDIQATRSERGFQVFEQPITSCKPSDKANKLYMSVVGDEIELYDTYILIF